MYGADPYGSVPYGATGYTPFDIEAMLSESREKLVYTVELTVWNIDGDVEEKLYLATAEWATSPTDVPASVPFDGRLEPYNFTRSIIGDRFGGMVEGSGDLSFSNPDGAYDAYVDDYAVDGREVIVRVGRKSDAWADHQIIFKGEADDWAANIDTVTVRLRDRAFTLDVPAQPNTYAGSGGAEGGADLENTRKPLTFGANRGVPLVLVNASLLIYQFHDNAGVPLVTAGVVYDRGVQLTPMSPAPAHDTYADLVAASPASGEYLISLDGYVRFGALPNGTVYIDGQGYFVASTQPYMTEIIDALVEIAGLTEADINRGSLDNVYAKDLAATRRVAIHLPSTDAKSVADVIGELVLGNRCWAGFNRRDLFTVGLVNGPTITVTEAVAYFNDDDGDIISLDQVSLPSGVWPPPWRWRVTYDQNYTVFNDFAGSVTDAIKAFYSQPYRLAEDSDPGDLTDHKRAQDPPPVEAHFTSPLTAGFMAGDLVSLYGNNRHLYRIVVDRRGLLCDVGKVIHVTHPRFGLSAGKAMLVVEIADKIDLRAGSGVEQVEITAFG